MSAIPMSLDSNAFILVYLAGGQQAPNYKVFPGAAGVSPFNTKLTPFLLPSDLERFGFNTDAVLGSVANPAWWGVRIQFFTEGGQVIPLKGSTGQHNLDHVDANVTAPIPPNGHGGAGFTPIDSVGVFRDSSWQPSDLAVGKPVRLRVSLLAYQDDKFQVPLTVDPTSGTLDIWLMRV